MGISMRSGAAVLALAFATAAGGQELPTIDAVALGQELELGPLKLTVGPQEGGDFGAILTGNATRAVPALNHVPSHERQKSPFTARYGAIEFNLDAGWSSAADALNQTTLGFKPSVTFVWLDGSKPPQPLSAELQNTCDELGRQAARAFDTSMTAADAAAKAAALEEFHRLQRSSQSLGCQKRRGEPPSSQWAVSFYPDVMYRFGEFQVEGERFRANQLITGLAGRVFVPGTSNSDWFREWPRVSAGYYTVSETEDSDIPLPEGIEEDQIKVSGKIALRLPLFGSASLATSPLHLDIEATSSRATSGADRDWHVVRQFQLSYDTGDKILPALTYRSGSDVGLQYDKQVILGLLWLFTEGGANK